MTSGPVTPPERIGVIDVLRGFALLGILVMNIQSFSMPDAAYLNPTAYGDLTGGNLTVWMLGHLLTDEKMFGLFSMLFGAGIVLMAERIEQRGGAPARVHYRRMGWLMLFGLLHGHLLWPGDVLWLYGLVGLVVYPLRRLPPRVLLMLALAVFAANSALFIAIGFAIRALPPDMLDVFARENWLPTAEMIAEEIETLGRSGWLQQMPSRMSDALFMETLGGLVLMGAKAFGNMLLGMALFKWGILTGQRSTRDYLLMMAFGFLMGLSVVAFGIRQHFAAGWDVRYSLFWGSQFNYWGAIIVDMGWIGLVVLVGRTFTSITRPLAAVGRTAFSNYILQTIICTTLFYGHGFGWFGTVSRVEQFRIVLAIWAFQLVVSPLWLRFFESGPLEWLWRSLTYGRPMSFLRRGAPRDVAHS